MDLVAEDINYYKTNRLNFITLYAGKFLVIKDKQVIGIYGTNSEAMERTLLSHEVGTFIIERPMTLKAGK